MPIVAKVSKPGFNVLLADNENLSFSSELATHSIYNVFTHIKAAGVTSVTITHNLGYVPKVWLMVSQGTPPNDHYRRIPVVSAALDVDFHITTTTIVITSDSAAHVFRGIIFTRSPNP